ncbi:MAG: hypothetical protein HRU28_00980 [Rhizobiales bacterium]|nr:hypothetical protein [Hyphomicrobiales bacterium]
MSQSLPHQIDAILDLFLLQKPRRTGSFIITLFGDVISARGGDVWLSNIGKILELFDMNFGLVRTTTTRLVADGWLKRAHVGRNSFYSFSLQGQKTAENAAHKIYNLPMHDWAGCWQQVVFIGNNSERNKQRLSVKKQLSALGFASINSQIMIKPQYFEIIETSIIQEICIDENILISNDVVYKDQTAIKQLANETWQLEVLNQEYIDFIKLYAPIYIALKNGEKITNQSALMLRLLLIHQYRKILLKDPYLPKQLHNDEWRGFETQVLVADIYKIIAPLADLALDNYGDNIELQKMKPVDKSNIARFETLT